MIMGTATGHKSMSSFFMRAARVGLAGRVTCLHGLVTTADWATAQPVPENGGNSAQLRASSAPDSPARRDWPSHHDDGGICMLVKLAAKSHLGLVVPNNQTCTKLYF